MKVSASILIVAVLSCAAAWSDEAGMSASVSPGATVLDEPAANSASPSAAASLSPTGAAAAPTAPVEGLSLDDCFKAALKQSESLASQKELLMQEEEHYKQALGSVLPNIHGNALWFWEDSHAIPAGPGEPTPEESTYSLTLTQPLFEGLRDFAALRQTKDSITQQDLATQWASLQLYSDTAQAFYLASSLEKDLSTQEGEVDLYTKRIAELRDFVRIGRSRDTEILTVQSAQAILIAQIEASKAQVAAAHELLSFLTGLPQDKPLIDDRSLPAALDSLEQYLQNIDARPDIKAAAVNVQMVGENVNIAKGQHLPSASLNADYYFQRPPGATQDSYWDADIAVTVPIFAGGIINSQTREAESQVRQAKLSLQMQRRLAEENLRTAYKSLHYDLSQAQALADAYRLADKNYKAESRDYSNGLVTNLDVLQALTDFEDTQRSLDKALFAAKNDFANLEALAARVPVPAQGGK
jgi:outer membrane protein